MKSILIQSEVDTREALITELWQYGTAGIIENTDTVQAFFEDDCLISQIVSQLSFLILAIKQETDPAATLDLSPNSDPIYAGRQFFIVSSWMDHSAPSNRQRLIINANDAFGSGSHESTQLVIQVLEDDLPRKATVLDIGCGSGILSEVAQRLGAGQVFACDTHIGSLKSARQHSPSSHFFAGSVDAIAHAAADVVIVNISARIIDLLNNELYRVAKPNGLLILTGFTDNRTPVKFRPRRVIRLNDWICWLCQPEDIVRSENQSQATLQPFPAQWW